MAPDNYFRGFSGKGLVFHLPGYLKDLLSINNAVLFGIIKSTLLFLVLPFLIVIIPYLVSPLLREKLTPSKYLLYYLPVIIPIMASAHVIKALLKMTSQVPYFSYIPGDILGVRTAEKIVNREIDLTIIPHQVDFLLTILISVILIGGITVSFLMVGNFNRRYLQENKAFSTHLLPVVYGMVFAVSIFLWRYVS